MILLGGMWHDFEGFASVMQPVFEAAGCQVDATYDLDVLRSLDRVGCDLVLMYTCLSKHRQDTDDSGPEKMTGDQISGLRRWVRQGGGLLAVHAATVIGDSSPPLGRLLGGIFLSHPQPFSFTVTPLSHEHPITAGIPAFEIFDEFYIQKYDPCVEIHMAAVFQDRLYPMVWSRSEARGRVVVLAPGHFPAVWQHPTYQRVMLQAAGWLLKDKSDTHLR